MILGVIQAHAGDALRHEESSCSSEESFRNGVADAGPAYPWDSPIELEGINTGPSRHGAGARTGSRTGRSEGTGVPGLPDLKDRQ